MAVTLAVTARARDESLEAQLERLLRGATAARAAPPVAWCARGDRIELLPLAALRAAGVPTGPFLAALTRSTVDDGSDPVDAVGLMGVFLGDPSAPGSPAVPMAMAFVEWPDGRWWQWRALVEPDLSAVRDDSATVRSALEGDPLPDRLGRWWSTGRRRRYTLALRRAEVVH
jgi:hypothetical protein